LLSARLPPPCVRQEQLPPIAQNCEERIDGALDSKEFLPEAYFRPAFEPQILARLEEFVRSNQNTFGLSRLTIVDKNNSDSAAQVLVVKSAAIAHLRIGGRAKTLQLTDGVDPEVWWIDQEGFELGSLMVHKGSSGVGFDFWTAKEPSSGTGEALLKAVKDDVRMKAGVSINIFRGVRPSFEVPLFCPGELDWGISSDDPRRGATYLYCADWDHVPCRTMRFPDARHHGPI
jgi:hypothetical protein